MLHRSTPNIGIKETHFGKVCVITSDHIGRTVYKTGNYQPHHDRFLKKYVSTDSVVVDIGAQIGVFTLKASCLSAKVHSFEPMVLHYLQLIRNIGLNQYTNIIPYNFAISDKMEVTKYAWSHDTNTGGSGLDVSLDINNPDVQRLIKSPVNCASDEPVLTKTLDSIDIPKVDFIKMDTEGCELLCIRGAVETIKRCTPVIMAEFHDHEKRVDSAITFLKEHGCDYVAEKIPDGEGDWLLLPPSMAVQSD